MNFELHGFSWLAGLREPVSQLTIGSKKLRQVRFCEVVKRRPMYIVDRKVNFED